MNPTELAQFNEKRNALVAQLAEFDQKGDHVNFTETRSKIDNMDAEIEKLDEARKQSEERNAYMKELENRGQRPAPSFSNPADHGRGVGGSGGDRRGTEEYRNDFNHFLATNERRAGLNIINGPDGQYVLAPAKYDSQIVTPAGTASGLRAKLNLTILTGTTDYKGVSLTARSGGFTKGRKIDLSNDTQASLTFNKRQLTLSPFKTFLKIDNPFLDNNGFMADPMGFVSGQLNELKEEGQEYYWIYGNGNAEPLGVMSADAQGIPSTKQIEASGAGGIATFGQLVAMQYAVKPKWRNTSEWYFSKDQCVQLDSMKDSTGQPVLKDSIGKDGPVKLLLGRPVNETEAITAAFSSATSGVFADDTLTGFYGDLKRYNAIESGIPAIKVDRSRLIEEDVALMIALFYQDGQPIDAEAFSVLKIVN
mgnify:CR=1 FL=1